MHRLLRPELPGTPFTIFRIARDVRRLPIDL